MALTPMSAHDLHRVVNIGTNRNLTLATGVHHDKYELLAVMHETKFIDPFDWGAWIKELPPGAFDGLEYLDQADLETLRKLVTAHVRMDRFVGGHLDAVLASGYMDRAMARARTLLETNAL